MLLIKLKEYQKDIRKEAKLNLFHQWYKKQKKQYYLYVL